jgi:1,4-dihydroxy-2-naphthoate octaprenyltransferase
LTYDEKFSILRSSKSAFLSTYLWIVGGVLTGQMPVFSPLIALLTLLPAIKAVRGALKHQELLPAMTNNVLVVLLIQFLLGVGYILASVFSG